MPQASVPVILSPADQKGPWGKELEASCLQALAIAEDRLGATLDKPPIIESIAPENAFYKALGMKPHNLMAVARAGDNHVIINRAQFIGAPLGTRMGTLIHEFSHLIVGRRVQGGAPRWLDEGIAMITAREHAREYHTRLMLAATFGGLKPLSELWQGSARADSELAYAQSMAATRFFLQEVWHRPDDPSPLVRKLADPVRGEDLRILLRDPNFIEAIEQRWKRSMRTIWTLFGGLAELGWLWPALALLLVLAYWRKQRMAKKVEEGWRQEGFGDPEDDGEDDEDEHEPIYLPYSEDEAELPLEEEDERF